MLAEAINFVYELPNAPSPSMSVSTTSGILVHPRFYTPILPALRLRKRVVLGFMPDLRTVFLLFGGTAPTDRISQFLDVFLASPPPDTVKIIAICAKIRALFDHLARRKQRGEDRRLFFTGLTSDVTLFMQISDLLVGSPGSAVVSEAFVLDIPSVLVKGVIQNNVMKQEKDMLNWVCG